MKRPNKFKYKKDARKAGADARKEVYDKLSTPEKIAQLNRTFGKNNGAAKQRIRLSK